MQLMWVGWAIFLTAEMMGCTLIPGNRGTEPAVLIIRNHSGQDIDTVTVSAAQGNAASGRRYGSISPVPRGASQVFVRPRSAPRLPKHLRLAWDIPGGKQIVREVALKPALGGRPSSRPAVDSMALVFEIRADHSVETYAEPYFHR